MSSQSHLTVGLLGHNGRVGAVVLKHLADAHLKSLNVIVLHRPGSNTSSIPSGIEAREVDLKAKDGDAFDKAVKGLNVLISVVGSTGIPDQAALIPALSRSKEFITFFPSDLGAPWTKHDYDGTSLGFLKAKDEVVEKARKANVGVTIPKAGLFIELGFGATTWGVDAKANIVNVYRKSLEVKKPLVSLAYIAESYIHLLKDPKAIAGKDVTFVELEVSDGKIAKILEEVHGTPPQLIEWDEKKLHKELTSPGFAAIGAGLLRKGGEDTWNFPGEKVVVPGWKGETIEEIVKKAAGKA